MDSYDNLTATCGGGGLDNCSTHAAGNMLYDVLFNSSLTDPGGTGSASMDGPDPEYAHLRDSSRFWVKRILFPMIMCIGVVGNGLTIIILTRRRMRSSTNHYLTALAFSDCFYLIFAFTLSLNDYSAMTTYAYYSYYRYGLMLTDACSNTSVWLTVTFTIERYVAVCHPIRGKVLCTRSRAKRVIMAVVFLCFLVVIPTPLEWQVVEDVVGGGGSAATSAYSLEPSELGANETYKTFYYWFTSTSFVFVPFTLLAIFNSFLIRSVHHSKTQRRRMTMRGKRHDHTHQENRITVMLIAVVILFLLCQLPTAVILVYTSIYTLHSKSNEYAVVLAVGNICNLLVSVNAACNFVLYCAFSDRYRRTFLRIFLPCLFRLASPTQSQTSTLNTAYTQVQDSDGNSVIKRGRNSLAAKSKGNNMVAAAARRSSPSVNIGLTQSSGRSSATNGQANKQARLEVPIAYNGMCGIVRELRKDSDATNDTSLSTEELSSTVTPNVLLAQQTPAMAVTDSEQTTITTANSNGKLPADKD